MKCFPEFSEFSDKYNAGESQLLWVNFLTDLETPVSEMMKLMQVSDYHLLFESVEGGESRARYSIIALDPDLIWRCVDGKPEINRDAAQDKNKFVAEEGTPFDSLRKLAKESELDIPSDLPPMAAGLFGYMGYDMVRYMENLPSNNPDTIGVPESIYIRPKIVVIFDSVNDEANIITTVRPEENTDAESAYEQAKKRVEDIASTLSASIQRKIVTAESKEEEEEFKTHVSEEDYHKIVAAAKEYIVAGDIFQVVASRRLSKSFNYHPFSFYRSLRHLNPSPYLFYLNLGDFAIVGSSPEILVRLKDGTVTIRPIAGTRKRGKNKERDIELEKELLSDKKELAEHLMLLDLGRNDVGRVARPGTVEVTEHMSIERYSHVMHIVSNVEGKIREDKDCIDALIAGFPAGTVSGAPKIRAMEIIDELENEKRSFYGGTVGYISASGELDTCIALRTALIKDNMIYVQAGGGIVADSDPSDEFLETQNKANALMTAAKNVADFNRS